MTQEQFLYWFQGFCELGGKTPPTQAQWDSIREHLNLVFNKVTKPVEETPAVEKPKGKDPLGIVRPKQVPQPPQATPRPPFVPFPSVPNPIDGAWPWVPPNTPGLPAVPRYPGDLDPTKVILTC